MVLENDSCNRDSDYDPENNNNAMEEEEDFSGKKNLKGNSSNKKYESPQNKSVQNIDRFEVGTNSRQKVRENKKYMSMSKKLTLGNVDNFFESSIKDNVESENRRNSSAGLRSGSKNKAIKKTNQPKMKEFNYLEKIHI